MGCLVTFPWSEETNFRREIREGGLKLGLQSRDFDEKRPIEDSFEEIIQISNLVKPMRYFMWGGITMRTKD